MRGMGRVFKRGSVYTGSPTPMSARSTVRVRNRSTKRTQSGS